MSSEPVSAIDAAAVRTAQVGAPAGVDGVCAGEGDPEVGLVRRVVGVGLRVAFWAASALDTQRGSALETRSMLPSPICARSMRAHDPGTNLVERVLRE